MTSAAKRVMYLDHTARWSGGEIALFRFLGALDRSRYDAVVVLGEEGAFAEKLRGIGVACIIEPLGGEVRETRKDTLGAGGLFRKAFAGGASVWNYARRVAALAREHQCDLLHTNSLKSDIYGALAGRMARVPVLWHIRDHIARPYLPGIAVRAMRTMARRIPAHVLCNSRSTQDSLIDAGSPRAARYTVVSDCVDDAFLQTPQPMVRTVWRDGGDARPIRIGIVGRLTRWKGQHVFLAAAQSVLKKWHKEPVQFVLAGGALFGEDEYAREIQAQAATAFAPGQVEWCGNIADVPGLLASLDLLVHASITPEPFGQVVIEGMAVGLPVIATNGGGVTDIITPGTDGLLVPMDDAGALAEAMLTLLDDPARATGLGRAGWQTVRDRYLPLHTARNIESVYKRLLG